MQKWEDGSHRLMFKDFEMWNYSFPRPHYNRRINFILKDWGFCHVAGRRIVIDGILTEKKLDGAWWCRSIWEVLLYICWLAVVWVGKGYTFHWSEQKFDYAWYESKYLSIWSLAFPWLFHLWIFATSRVNFLILFPLIVHPVKNEVIYFSVVFFKNYQTHLHTLLWPFEAKCHDFRPAIIGFNGTFWSQDTRVSK